MRKTWDEKYTEWLKRSGWPVHAGARFAYHTGRRHQREELRRQILIWRERVKKIFRIMDVKNNEIEQLTRERNEYKAKCEALLREDRMEKEMHAADRIKYCQQRDEYGDLRRESTLQRIQNVRLKNQVRALQDTIFDLKTPKSWWKFWKVDW